LLGLIASNTAGLGVAGIPRFRRWVIEEEGVGNQPVRAKASLPHIADGNASSSSGV
jgi:hypothetical protein